MLKNIIILISFFSFIQCSLDTKTGFWTKTKIIEENKANIQEIFKTNEILKKEFNSGLKIKINNRYKKKPFVNNLSNNTGYINYDGNFNNKFKFKFKKIKKFEFIHPDLMFGNDESFVFFDDKGSILKFSQNSKLIWKRNHYTKKQIKQKPIIYFATNNNLLIAADTLSNLYAMDYSNGNLVWKINNNFPYNSDIKIFKNKIYLVDFENNIKCYSIEDGKELWSFGTEKTFIKSQRKLSLIIKDNIIVFIDSLGDINALDINNGRLIWQSQTINEDIFESAFLLKSSRLVNDDYSLYVSNNRSNFVAINLKNGFSLWEQPINSSLDPSIVGNFLFTISDEGYFFVIDKLSGNILRSTNILNIQKNKNIYPTGFVVAKKFIYVSMSNGKIFQVSIDDGKTKDIIKIDSSKISRPYIFNKKMYVLSNNSIIKID